MVLIHIVSCSGSRSSESSKSVCHHVLPSHALPAPAAAVGSKTSISQANSTPVSLFSACRFLYTLQTGFDEYTVLLSSRVHFFETFIAV